MITLKKRLYKNPLKISWLQSNPRSFFEPLFAELPQYGSEYIRYIFTGSGQVVRNGAVHNDDYSNPYVQVKNGLRHTTDQPERYSHAVHVLGPSWVYGFGAEDGHTTPSYLQRMLNARYPETFIVHNGGVRGAFNWNLYLRLQNIALAKGDTVVVVFPVNREDLRALLSILNKMCAERGARFLAVFAPRLKEITNPSRQEMILSQHTYEELHAGNLHEVVPPPPGKYAIPVPTLFCQMNHIAFFDLQNIFNRPHGLGEIYFDASHWCYKAHEAVASTIFSLLFDAPPETYHEEPLATASFRALARCVRDQYHTDEILHYVAQVKNEKWAKRGPVGSIVMNANPFTKGHRHLVEKALEKVEALYVFVVENDESFFSFEDRIRLARQNVHDLGDRVHVVPSGQFIVSSFTFPEYFTKETRPVAVDSSLDILLFGSIIAPALEITSRFAGEEPHCRVTQSYNATMGKYLPPMGIALEIIPRKKVHEQTVSASHVRKLLSEGRVQALRPYVPPSTYEFLRDRAGPSKNVFPSGFQSFLVSRVCAPLVKVFAPPRLRAKFTRDPEAFFADSTSAFGRLTRGILALFGPPPQK